MIVAIGIGALQYVIRSRDELWPGVPVVFTFVDPQLLSALPADFTGTTFRLKLSDMIAAARVVVPSLNRIAVVGDPLQTLVPYFWQTLVISAVVVVQTLLLAALFYEDRRRRRLEANAQVLMAELTHMSRVVTAGQLTASIAHEIRQPLAAIATFGNASINWLKHKTPDLDEVRSNLDNMVEQVHRADDVIKSVTALFKKESTTRRDVNLNELVQQVLTYIASDKFEQDCAGNEFHPKPAADRYGRPGSATAGHSESDHECN